jgi:hypothetical protein
MNLTKQNNERAGKGREKQQTSSLEMQNLFFVHHLQNVSERFDLLVEGDVEGDVKRVVEIILDVLLHLSEFFLELGDLLFNLDGRGRRRRRRN